MRTSRLNHNIPMPSPRVDAGVNEAAEAGRRERADRLAVTTAEAMRLRGRLAGVVDDRGDDPEGLALGAVTEVLVVRLAPAVERVGHGLQRGRLRERVARVGGALHLDVADVHEGTEAGLGVELLALRRLREVDEVLGRLRGVLGGSARGLDQQR